MSIAALEQRLALVDREPDHLRLQGRAVFGDLIPALLAIPARELVGCLLSWRVHHPDGLGMLFDAASASDEASDHVAAALVHVLSQWLDVPRTDAVLVRAFPRLVSPQRDWAAEREGVNGPLGLVEGRDYQGTGELADEERWPDDESLPPGDSVAGLQARLQTWDLNPGPVTGSWNERTRVALRRFQFEHFLAGPEVDEETLRTLGIDGEELERARQRGFQLVEGSPEAVMRPPAS